MVLFKTLKVARSVDLPSRNGPPHCRRNIYLFVKDVRIFVAPYMI